MRGRANGGVGSENTKAGGKDASNQYIVRATK